VYRPVSSRDLSSCHHHHLHLRRYRPENHIQGRREVWGNWVAEVGVAADGFETVCLDTQEHLAAGCMAALYFSSQGGAV
jgi:hypothetical protein